MPTRAPWSRFWARWWAVCRPSTCRLPRRLRRQSVRWLQRRRQQRGVLLLPSRLSRPPRRLAMPRRKPASPSQTPPPRLMWPWLMPATAWQAWTASARSWWRTSPSTRSSSQAPGRSSSLGPFQGTSGESAPSSSLAWSTCWTRSAWTPPSRADCPWPLRPSQPIAAPSRKRPWTSLKASSRSTWPPWVRSSEVWRLRQPGGPRQLLTQRLLWQAQFS
mmetsp:Transcript_89055/g.160610  ORF Transcript_89055/g.160610 Transcript_89055/m.160610 type:complete len:218 (-) Transcript_89055:584-1237(-)